MLSALAMIILTLGVGLFVSLPLLTGAKSRKTRTPDHEMSNLFIRRDQLFHDIREMELDYKTGKLSDEDYEANITQLKSEAAEVLAKIGQAKNKPVGKAAKRRRTGVRTSADLEVEALIAAARKGRETDGDQHSSEGQPCSSCGTLNPPDAQFCMKCGAPLTATAKGTS